MEEKGAKVNTPATDEIERLLATPTDLVYVQFSESGAMGRPGETILGELVQEELVIHHFNCHKWDEDDRHFLALMNKLSAFVSHTTASANSSLGTFGRKPAPECEHFKAAFDVGNHVMRSQRREFVLGDICIYLVTNDTRTPLLLTSAPLSIFGPRLFPDSRDQDGG